MLRMQSAQSSSIEIEKKMFHEGTASTLDAEASTLGWRPGEWPTFFMLIDGEERVRYGLVYMSAERGVYHPPKSTVGLRSIFIQND